MKNNLIIWVCNIIYIIALLFLGFFTFLGKSFISENIGMNIFITILFVIICCLLILFLIRIKGTNKDFTKWKYIELLFLIAYITISIVFAKYPTKCLSILNNKELIKSSVIKDKNNINEIVKHHKNKVDDCFNTENNIKNNFNLSDSLINFCSKYNIENANYSLNNYYNILKSKVNKNYFEENNNLLKNIDNLNTIIETWDMIKFYKIHNYIDNINSNIVEYNNYIEEINHKYYFPIIDKYSNINRYEQFESITLNLECSKIIIDTKPTAIDYIIYILLHLAILSKYLIASRSNKLDIKKSKTAISLGTKL